MEGSEIIGIGAEAKLYTFEMFDVETVVKERYPGIFPRKQHHSRN